VGDPVSKANFVLDQTSGLLTEFMELDPSLVLGVANKLTSNPEEASMDLSEAEWAILRSLALYGWASYSIWNMEQADDDT
jgi:hypothetical protein